MKSQPENLSEDRQTIRRRLTSSNSTNGEPIPNDLMIEILSRLPAKSIARFRCISKLWASRLGLPYLTELFLTRSSSRQQLLFACEKNDKLLLFFCAPQSPNPDEKSSTVANHLAHFPTNRLYSLLNPINGFVCFLDEQIFKGRKTTELVTVICNPSTGQSLTLPKAKTRRRVGINSYFGYDPTAKQFKVLCMTWPVCGRNGGISEEHQVLTLETGKLSWRMVECCIPHFPGYDKFYGSNEICINGVLYYPAAVNMFARNTMIVCFDVRFEKFSVMKINGATTSCTTTLINYNGKLGSVLTEGSCFVSGTSFQLWVLEDSEKRKWSKHLCVLPPLWDHLAGNIYLRIIGVTRENEIVLSPRIQIVPFYVFYYNVERNTIIRVTIQGMEAFEHRGLHTFLNHVENVKLMQAS